MIYNEHTYNQCDLFTMNTLTINVIYNEHTYALWFTMGTLTIYVIYNEHTYNQCDL